MIDYRYHAQQHCVRMIKPDSVANQWNSPQKALATV